MTSTTFRTDALMSYMLRCWRCRPWSANPLMRWPDRLLAAVRLVGVMAVLVSIPIAGAVGSVAYTDDAAQVRVARSQTTAVDALVLDRPRHTSPHIRRATVSWTGAAGSTVTTVPVLRGVDKGDRIQVWLDSSGNPTSAPRPPVSAVLYGIGVALLIICGTGFLAWCSAALTERVVMSRRKAAWDQQLSQMSG